MEISNEIKAKVFAQYLGQQCYNKGWASKPYSLEAKNLHYDLADIDKLILKPLSAITDEDAIEVAKLMFSDEDDIVVYNGYGFEYAGVLQIHNSVYCIVIESIDKSKEPNVITETNVLQIDPEDASIIVSGFHNGSVHDDALLYVLQAYDFLRANGYDLPSWYLGRRTLLESGLAVYPPL